MRSGLRRYAASLFLSLLTTIFIVVGAAQAQPLTSFNFLKSGYTRAECPVLVLYGSIGIGQYDVEITAVGMVFDHTQEYSKQLCEQTISAQIGVTPTGLFHSSWTGGTPPTLPFGDLGALLSARIGAGWYKIEVIRGGYTTTVYLDLTDGNWANGATGFRNIVIEPCPMASDGAWVHFSEENAGTGLFNT